MIYLPLSRGLVAVIDDQDSYLSAHKWHASVRKYTSYAARNQKDNTGAKHNVFLHRVIMSALPGQYVDHIDGDGLNNRRDNLRLVTASENQQNRRRFPKHKTSRFRGVSWCAARLAWQVSIKFNNKAKSLGCFQLEEDAAAAYEKAAKILFTTYDSCVPSTLSMSRGRAAYEEVHTLLSLLRDCELHGASKSDIEVQLDCAISAIREFCAQSS